MGGLEEKGITAKQLHERHGRSSPAQKSEKNPVADLVTEFSRMHRARENTVPMHNARSTTVYSVSFPV